MSSPDGGSDSGESLCSRFHCNASIVPLFVGGLLSTFLLGVVMVLAVAAHWGRSARTQGLIVAVVAVQIALSTADAVRLTLKFASNFGDVPFMISTLVSDALAPFLGTLIQVQTQFFMLGRARHFARLAYPVPGRDVAIALIGLLILGSGACGCATAVWTRMLGSYAELVPGSTAPEYYTVCLQVWLATSAGVDIILAVIITHELIHARKSSTRQSTNAAWVRAVARRLIVVVVQSGVLLATVQTIAIVLWRMEMRQGNKHGEAYVLLPITVLPKLYTLTFLVILLCTPPPRAIHADSSTSNTPHEPLTKALTNFDTVIDLAPREPNLVPTPPPRPTRPNWISTHSHRSDGKAGSALDSGFAGSFSSATRSAKSALPRFALPVSVSSWAGRGPNLRRSLSEGGGEASSGLQSELEYYRSYAEALEAARSPRPTQAGEEEDSPAAVATVFPLIEHPFAHPATPAHPYSQPSSPVERSSTPSLTPEANSSPPTDPGHSASTMISFEIEQDMSGDSFGTLQRKERARVRWHEQVERVSMRREYAEHARRFMQGPGASQGG